MPDDFIPGIDDYNGEDQIEGTTVVHYTDEYLLPSEVKKLEDKGIKVERKFNK